jgi:hypothetical protein
MDAADASGEKTNDDVLGRIQKEFEELSSFLSRVSDSFCFL